MATRRVSRAVRLGTAAALVASTIAFLPGTSTAEPNLSISEVQQRVDVLYEQAEAATERAHNASVEVQDAREHLARVRKQLAAQQKQFDQLSEAIADYAAQLYATGGVDPTVQMMFSANPDDLLLQSQVLDQVTTSQDERLRLAEAAQLALKQTQALVDQQVAHLKDLRAEAAKEKAAANAKLHEAQALLSRLKQAQRDRLAQLQQQQANQAQRDSQNAISSVPTNPTPVSSSGSGRGAVAADFARAQLGKPYVFGAAGPSAFDCSGLTMAAWARAGVYLPHAASQQYAMITHVSTSSLQPGDLLFFYSDIHHVGIYVGGGIFVHAANPSVGVVANNINDAYYQSVLVGAGRP